MAPSTQHPAPSTQHPAHAGLWLPLIAAAVLFAAGVLKIVELARSGVLAALPVELMLATAIFEIAVAVWFALSRTSPFLPTAGLAVFSFMGLVALGWYALGTTSCPCFGPLRVHPLLALALDFTLAVFFASKVYRQPRLSMQVTGREFLRYVISNYRAATFVMLVLAMPAAMFVWNRFAKSTPILITDLPVSPIEVAPGQKLKVSVTVYNNSGRTARIFGGGTNCGCLTLTDLPVIVDSNRSVKLDLELNAPATLGDTEVRFVYYIDHPEQYHLAGAIKYRVVSSPILLAPALKAASTARGLRRVRHRLTVLGTRIPGTRNSCAVPFRRTQYCQSLTAESPVSVSF